MLGAGQTRGLRDQSIAGFPLTTRSCTDQPSTNRHCTCCTSVSGDTGRFARFIALMPVQSSAIVFRASSPECP